ncbi:flotillin-2 [Brevipalpus obovatus]|uniref:flotillin-2 n=1 Tax=Brevipalpus obovatus TaxID=246614 RepID=UPI003D9EFCB7
MGNIHIVGPNEALIVSGGCCRSASKSMVVGGWTWVCCCMSNVQKLSLEVMTVSLKCENVETLQGVPVTVTAVAQCKIMTEKDFLSLAAEQFLGKNVEHIKSVILQNLEGHVRAVMGTQKVETIYRERNTFAELVREVVTPDISKMGIEVLSFTVKDVVDPVDYLSSLGKAQIAIAKKEAVEGVAKAEKEAGILESQFERETKEHEYQCSEKLADLKRIYLTEKAEHDRQVNTLRAEAQLAYELQEATTQQEIRKVQLDIDLTERKGQIEVDTQEVIRKTAELMALVRHQADAEAFKVKTLAEAKKQEIMEAAEAEADRVRKIGVAEASAIRTVGNAEAERMRLKAAAYKQYEDAAILSLALEALPKVAAEITAPLAKTEEVIILTGPTGTTNEVARLTAQIPPVVQTLKGFDILKRTFMEPPDKPK